VSNITFATPVTGAAQVGLTSPTYSLTQDRSPDDNAIQYAVTALGGTQTGVVSHSASAPFTAAVFAPKHIQTLGNPDVQGIYRSVPKNKWKFVFRKAVDVGNTKPEVAILRVEMEIPAGADVNDDINVRALLSLGFGLIAQESSGVGNMVVSGLW
jgi:hypothetical protein